MWIRSLTCAVFAVAISGCASKQQTAPTPTTATAAAQPAPQPRSSKMCPMMVDPATTQVTTSDTSDGVAIAFTTTADVNELRTRVRHMADMHNQMVGMRAGETGGGGGMQGGMQGGMGMHEGMQSGRMPAHEHVMRKPIVASRATAEDIPGGARIVLVPVEPSELTALRQDARMRAEMMQSGQCPMMAPQSPAREGERQRYQPSTM